MIDLPAVARARKTTLIAVTSALIACGLAAPARAGADTVTVTGVLTSATGGLLVQLPDPDALWVRASVLSSTDATPIATVDDLTWDGSQWSTRAPLRLPLGSSYGDYAVTVDYRLAGGTTQHWSSTDRTQPDVFAYRRRVTVTAATADRSTTDLDHRTVTVTGTAAVYDPATDTTTASPAGTRVRLGWDATTGGYADTTLGRSVTTDADGRFAVTLTSPGSLTDGTALADGPDPTTVSTGASPLPDVPALRTTTRIVAAPVHARVHRGASVTVSGTAQRLTANGWVAWSAAPIVTALQPADDLTGSVSRVVASGTTGTDGRFSYSVRPGRTADVYTQVRPSPYTTDQDALTEHLDVPTAGSYSLVHYTLDQFGGVKATGALRGQCSEQRISLQYSRTGHGAWGTLASTTVAFSGSSSCAFTLAAGGYVDGYYRVTHAESDQLLAATAASARLHRIPTRITSFTLTPRRPSTNGTLRATGAVSQRSGKGWRALAGASVELVWRPKGDTQFYLIATSRTDRSGRFSLPGKVYGDGTWGLFYNADAAHFFSETALKVVDAR